MITKFSSQMSSYHATKNFIWGPVARLIVSVVPLHPLEPPLNQSGCGFYHGIVDCQRIRIP